MTEAEALQRLIDAARRLLHQGTVDHDDFIVFKEYADDLRQALAIVDQAQGIPRESE